MLHASYDYSEFHPISLLRVRTLVSLSLCAAGTVCTMRNPCLGRTWGSSMAAPQPPIHRAQVRQSGEFHDGLSCGWRRFAGTCSEELAAKQLIISNSPLSASFVTLTQTPILTPQLWSGHHPESEDTDARCCVIACLRYGSGTESFA